MDFTAFDTTDIEQYKDEVRERWGKTAAYRESQTRTPAKDAPEQMSAIFARLGALRRFPAESPEVQEAVARLAAAGEYHEPLR